MPSDKKDVMELRDTDITEIPDVEEIPTMVEAEAEAVTEAEPEAEPETKTEEQPKRKTWVENFNVKEVEDVETIDRLTVKVGVNEYKGSYQVFLAKVTDKEFSRQFFAMPAHVWEKAITILQKHIPRIAEIEKRSMADAVTVELQRLKELGIDISAIVKKVQ